MEKVIEDWRRRNMETELELENSQKECRLQATEAFKVKGQYDEAHDTIEALRKDNKNLLGMK